MAGHRRKRACELAGLEAMPAIVRDLDRDSAIIVMVDTNIQRENISPMLRQSDYVVTYITHSWGGAAQFAAMAERQGKNIISL